MPAKHRTARLKSSATPLDAKQRALLDQQEKLRVKMEKLQRMIQEAPQRAEAQEKIRREELLARSSQNSPRSRSRALEDKRHNATLAEPFPAIRRQKRRPLRSEQRQARLIFFALLLGLALVLVWLWSVWAR